MSLNINTDEDNTHSVSLNQIKMWIIPQKTENDDKYDINRGYFELLVQQTLHVLITNGYIKSSYRDEAEYGDEQVYSLTEKGEKYLEEMATNINTVS
ncbi:MAG TPA: hypothetical protein VFD60_12105 [Nitrososphaeraceae archaeon]|nr:hypothetical protein [Nitrososphaeraceae archaeon]